MTPALIIDEAQSLPYHLLEEVRLLSNTEAANGKSLAVALVGQPELAARLNDPRLRQLKQRVALRCELTPLTLEDTAAYIAERVRIAGGIAHLLFTREAVVAIHERSKGIPRTISVICDNALVSGFAADAKPVGADVILEVCRDFAIGAEAEAVAAAFRRAESRTRRRRRRCSAASPGDGVFLFSEVARIMTRLSEALDRANERVTDDRVRQDGSSRPGWAFDAAASSASGAPVTEPIAAPARSNRCRALEMRFPDLATRFSARTSGARSSWAPTRTPRSSNSTAVLPRRCIMRRSNGGPGA